MSGERLESLDVFRGVTIAAMILVSTPGTWEAVYWPLDHATWNGWTPTDLIFPFLLFAMGAAVPAARRKRHRDGLHGHVIRRALILFGLGLLLNVVEAHPPLTWPTFRILGVLQRIAIVYAVVAWLTEHSSRRTLIGVSASILLGYWALLTLVPVPGIGAGVLTPEGNLASFIDRSLLHRHLAFSTWESEGLLSTLPSIVTALCGVFAGEWLLGTASRRHHSALLFLAGTSAALMGLAWDRVFPINKNLWTSSFTLLTAGLAAQLLAICHWSFDLRQWNRWSTPFVAFGRNALAAYVLSVGLDSLLTRWTLGLGPGLSLKDEVYTHAFEGWAVRCCGAEAASLFYALTYVALWGVVVTLLYRRRVFLLV